MKLYFTDSEHKKAFKQLRNLRNPSKLDFSYTDYMYGYYVLTADQKLRTFINKFLDKKTGNIQWSKMLESNIIEEDYHQVVAFAHQLYAGGWQNGNFDFIQLLKDLRGKQGILETVLEAARLYSSDDIIWWEVA